MQEVPLECPSFAPKKQGGICDFNSTLVHFTSLVVGLSLGEQPSFFIFSFCPNCT